MMAMISDQCSTLPRSTRAVSVFLSVCEFVCSARTIAVAVAGNEATMAYVRLPSLSALMLVMTCKWSQIREAALWAGCLALVLLPLLWQRASARERQPETETRSSAHWAPLVATRSPAIVIPSVCFLQQPLGGSLLCRVHSTRMQNKNI